MPKSTRKNRSQRIQVATSSRDDDTGSIDDGISLCSNVSDLTSIYDETETGYSTANESTGSLNLLEDRLDAAIENLRKKDFKTRENALQTLQTLFCQKFISKIVSERSENLLEVLSTSLKKGNEIERKLSAMVTSLFVIQLGETNEELYQTFRDILLPIIRDDSKSSSVRSQFCQTLGLLCFLLSEEVSSTIDLMNNFEKIFSQSYSIGNGEGLTTSFDSEICEIHTNALLSWCLLVSTLPTNYAHETIRLFLPEKIPSLIESQDAELRNETGEVVAVLYEIAQEIQSIFAQPPESLLILLNAKATESGKSKGKKEKRIQRSTFREICASFEEGKTPNFDVKFGRELLRINSWTKRFYYNLFSRILSSGIVVHLQSNNFLRSIFNLIEAEKFNDDDDETKKSLRADRRLAKKVAFKIRTKMLRKSRANKSFLQTFDDLTTSKSKSTSVVDLTTDLIEFLLLKRKERHRLVSFLDAKTNDRGESAGRYRPCDPMKTKQKEQMPFFGQDWRSDGDQWMKTDVGSWRRIRRDSFSNSSNFDLKSNLSLSDVFNGIEMVKAIENPRRFPYVLKIIQILFTEKLGELSGNAQRTVFEVLERAVDTAVQTGDFLFKMQRLITQFETSIHLAYPFYHYIGSAALWKRNVETLRRLKEKLNEKRSKLNEEKNDNSTSKFENLPTEIRFEILKRFDNGDDLIGIGLINSSFYRLIFDSKLWKNLCFYHFDEKIHRFIKRQQNDKVDWKKTFFRFKRRHDLKENYAETIGRCEICKIFVWKNSSEHLCRSASTSIVKFLTPRKFLALLL